MIQNNSLRFILFLLFTCTSLSQGFARDINLDAIYLKNESLLYKRLQDYKTTAYRLVKSKEVDSQVSFARWLSGNTIVYAKEYGDLFILYSYTLASGRKSELSRFSGIITALDCIENDSRVLVHTMKRRGQGATENVYLINLYRKPVQKLRISKGRCFFLSQKPGAAIGRDSTKGILVYNHINGKWTVRVTKDAYADIAANSRDTVLFKPKEGNSSFFLSGGGGLYRSKLVTRNGTRSIKGISSSREVYWISYKLLAIRKGGLGSFYSVLYDTEKNRAKAFKLSSLNTNLCYSQSAGYLTMLHNQLFYLYNIKRRILERTGLEGEDVYISPEGLRVLSLLNKKLYITRKSLIRRKQVKLKSHNKSILKLYQQFIKQPKTWRNDFSPKYLSKKIQAYRWYLAP